MPLRPYTFAGAPCFSKRRPSVEGLPRVRPRLRQSLAELGNLSRIVDQIGESLFRSRTNHLAQLWYQIQPGQCGQKHRHHRSNGQDPVAKDVDTQQAENQGKNRNQQPTAEENPDRRLPQSVKHPIDAA